MGSLRLGQVVVQIDDIIDGPVLHVTEFPQDVEEIRELLSNVVTTIEEHFGYRLGIQFQ